MFFVEDDKSQKCFVQTWDDHSLMSVCIWVEPLGQVVPKAELSGCHGLLAVPRRASCLFPIMGAVPLWYAFSVTIGLTDGVSFCFVNSTLMYFCIASVWPIRRHLEDWR